MYSRNYSNKPLLSDDAHRVYERASVVVVYKTKEEFGGLSNMASGFPLFVNDIRIPTSEALYQACRFPHLPDVQKLIIGQVSPMTAKMKAKACTKETRSDWDDIRFKVMRWCLRVKLNQNIYKFGQLLLSTKGKTIVEQSRKDAYWGAKLTDDGDYLIGQNVLGRLLMELRERLIEHGEAAFEIVEPLPVSDFLLLGNPIKDVVANHSPMKQQDALF